jgi:hypothetical protein
MSHPLSVNTTASDLSVSMLQLQPTRLSTAKPSSGTSRTRHATSSSASFLVEGFGVGTAVPSFLSWVMEGHVKHAVLCRLQD